MRRARPAPARRARVRADSGRAARPRRRAESRLRRSAAGGWPRGRRWIRRAGGDRANWDAPYIISPHLHTRLYWGSNYLYRSDDRGDSWTRISPDLTRNLDWRTLPIMGKVWPLDGSIELHTSTTALSTIVVDRRVAAARRPALHRHRRRPAAGDGGRRQDLAQGRGLSGRAEVDVRERRVRVAARLERRLRRVQQLAARRLQAVRRCAATIAAGRSRTSRATCRTSTTCGPSMQDHVNGNLLFAGTEFGAVLHASTAAATGCSSRAARRRCRCATCRCRGARATSSWHVRPRLLDPRRLQRRCAR